MIGSNNTISVARLSYSSNKATFASAHVTGISCYIEQAQADLAQFYDGSASLEVFVCTCEEVIDVKESDQVTDEYGNVFMVKAVKHYRHNSDVPNHTHIVMMQDHADV